MEVEDLVGLAHPIAEEDRVGAEDLVGLPLPIAEEEGFARGNRVVNVGDHMTEEKHAGLINEGYRIVLFRLNPCHRKPWIRDFFQNLKYSYLKVSIELLNQVLKIRSFSVVEPIEISC